MKVKFIDAETINRIWSNKVYSFFFVDKHGERHTFYDLSERTAKMMYKTFNRDMALYGYLQVGWNKEI
jgi:hypothetical protein